MLITEDEKSADSRPQNSPADGVFILSDRRPRRHRHRRCRTISWRKPAGKREHFTYELRLKIYFESQSIAGRAYSLEECWKFVSSCFPLSPKRGNLSFRYLRHVVQRESM